MRRTPTELENERERRRAYLDKLTVQGHSPAGATSLFLASGNFRRFELLHELVHEAPGFKSQPFQRRLAPLLQLICGDMRIAEFRQQRSSGCYKLVKSVERQYRRTGRSGVWKGQRVRVDRDALAGSAGIVLVKPLL